METKTKISKRKLVAYGLGIGGCGVLLAGSSEATLVDVTFGFGTPLELSAGGNFTGALTPAGNGDTQWWGKDYGAGAELILVGGGGLGVGFYNDGVFGGNGGMATDSFAATNVSSTWGDGSHGGLDAAKKGESSFANSYGTNVPSTSGVLGFKSSTGNWGYMEFSWDLPSFTLTVDSAKVETVPGVAATFTPVAIPEPNSATLMALLSLGIVGLRTARRRKVA